MMQSCRNLWCEAADRLVSRHAWRKMLDEVNDSSILKTGHSIATTELLSGDSAVDEPHRATIA
jgi:hypothetical protein